MKNSNNAIWFEGKIEIHCTIIDIEKSFSNMGEHFKAVIKHMPGMSSVELIETGNDFVIIKTNEGIMKRTNISIISDGSKVLIEFDEEYQAGKTIKTNSHFVEEFETMENKIRLQLTIKELIAPGFMGFFYRNFGSKNIGNAFLEANRLHFQ